MCVVVLCVGFGGVLDEVDFMWWFWCVVGGVYG